MEPLSTSRFGHEGFGHTGFMLRCDGSSWETENEKWPLT